MPLTECPKCGLKAAPEQSACPSCRAAVNGSPSQQTNGTAPTVEGPSLAAKVQVPPEVLSWARQNFNEEQFLAGLREIRATGGLQFEDFVKDLERAVQEHD